MRIVSWTNRPISTVVEIKKAAPDPRDLSRDADG